MIGKMGDKGFGHKKRGSEIGAKLFAPMTYQQHQK